MTLLEIKRQFELIAQNHRQINSFGWGDIWEIATSGTIDYPLMWVKIEPVSIADRVQTMNFKVILMDIVANGEVNEDDVLSDMLEVSKGIIGQLESPSYDWDLETGNIEPFTERFNDSVSGWVTDIALRLPFTFDRCIEPYNGSSGTSATCPSVTIYDSNGNVLTTVSAGGSYTVSGSAGGTINVYLDGVLQSSTSSTDLDAETVNILWT